MKVIQTMLNADSNQYFITTHSPYVINEFLENKADVAIFLTDYVDGEGCGKREENRTCSSYPERKQARRSQTRIRALNDDEITSRCRVPAHQPIYS